MLLKQCSALPLGHAAPHTELDPVVEGVGQTLEHNRAVPTDHCRFALRRTTYEEFVGIRTAAYGLGNPGDSPLVLHAAQDGSGGLG